MNLLRTWDEPTFSHIQDSPQSVIGGTVYLPPLNSSERLSRIGKCLTQSVMVVALAGAGALSSGIAFGNEAPLEAPESATSTSFQTAASTPIFSTIRFSTNETGDAEGSNRASSTHGDIEMQFEVLEVYGNTFKGQVTLVNTGQQTMQGWILEFAASYPIREFWNTELVSSGGGQYSIQNVRWNGSLLPGQSVDFGFIGYSPRQAFPAPELLNIYSPNTANAEF